MACRTHPVTEAKQQALLGEDAGEGTGHRHVRVPALNRFRACAVHFDDLKVASLQGGEIVEAHVEARDMHLAHRARDAVDPGPQRRRDVPGRVLVTRADTQGGDRRQRDVCAASRARREGRLAACRFVGTYVPPDARVGGNEHPHRAVSVADHRWCVAERHRYQIPVARVRHADMKEAGLVARRHQRLQDEGAVLRKDRGVAVKIRIISNPAHAIAAPADIRLGDQRIAEPALPEPGARVLAGSDAAPGRDVQRVDRIDQRQAGSLRFSREAARLDRWIDRRRQGKAAIAGRQPEPLHDQGNAKQPFGKLLDTHG